VTVLGGLGCTDVKAIDFPGTEVMRVMLLSAVSYHVDRR